jgi:hypothetical protein
MNVVPAMAMNLRVKVKQNTQVSVTSIHILECWAKTDPRRQSRSPSKPVSKTILISTTDRQHDFRDQRLQPSTSATMEDKNMTDINEFHVDSADRKVVLASDVKSKKVFSSMLILALISFQATSVLYGYDDKVIGSVAAMEQFVSMSTICKCPRY